MGYYILSLNQLWDFSSLYSFDIIFFFPNKENNQPIICRDISLSLFKSFLFRMSFKFR